MYSYAAMKPGYMQSFTKPSHMQLPKPAMLQSTYKRLNQNNKNCQSTKIHNYEECPVRPVYLCNDKNCLPSKCVHMQKPAMPQSTYKKLTQSIYLWSVSKTDSKEI